MYWKTIFAIHLALYADIYLNTRLASAKDEVKPKKDFEETCFRGNHFKLGVDHEFGNCSSYNGNFCLCEIRGNCAYDFGSEMCTPVKDCSLYNDKPVQCRSYHCTYDCTTGVCSTGKETMRSCFEPLLKCPQHCSDVCSCNANDCQISTTGKCTNKKVKICADESFKQYQCRRANAFYALEGTICKNLRQQGNCEVEKTVKSVNFGASSVMDTNGILYEAEKANRTNDPYNIKKIIMLDSTVGLSERDRNFYGTIAYGDSTKRETGRCINYNVSFAERGAYELVIKTIEVFDVLEGEKTFNIKFGDRFIFSEVDVVGLAGSQFNPVDLMVYFNVKDNVISIEGYPPIVLKNKTATLEFCFGECIFMEGYFEVAAFSVSKLVDMKPTDCNRYDGAFWDCTGSGCRYNHENGSCLGLETNLKDLCPPPPKCPEKEETCILPSVEMTFLVDSSMSDYGEVEPYISYPFDTIGNLSKIVGTFNTKFPRSKFGISLYSDYHCSTYVDCTKEYFPGLKQHDDWEGCYRHHQPLTEDIPLFLSRADRKNLTLRFSVGRQPAWFGTMMTIEDRKMGWTRHSGLKCVFKILVLISDTPTFSYYENRDGKKAGLAPAKFDGTDSCTSTAHPVVARMNNFYHREEMSIFFLMKRDNFNKDHFVEYTNYLDIPYEFGWMDDKPSDIVAQISEFIVNEHTKRNCQF